MITNREAGTNIVEVAEGIYRINTPLGDEIVPGGFSFNQYLIVDDEPLLFHTGLRKTFPLIREAISAILPVEKLRWIALSHFEADECGAMNELLAVAPHATPVCSRIAAMTSVGDAADRPPRALADGEELVLGRHTVHWFDTPHVPHSWECGSAFETQTKTLLCGDLFTQGGRGETALTESDILGPSEAMRGGLDYYAHSTATRPTLERLAAVSPTTLACMHGSAWRGDGGALIRALADRLDPR